MFKFLGELYLVAASPKKGGKLLMDQKSLLPNYPVIGLVAKVSEEHDAWHYHLIVDELRRAILDSGGIPRGILSPQLHSDFQYVDEADYSTLSPLSYNILRLSLIHI